jgi:hypothetical protein
MAGKPTEQPATGAATSAAPAAAPVARKPRTSSANPYLLAQARVARAISSMPTRKLQLAILESVRMGVDAETEYEAVKNGQKPAQS